MGWQRALLKEETGLSDAELGEGTPLLPREVRPWRWVLLTYWAWGCGRGCVVHVARPSIASRCAALCISTRPHRVYHKRG